MSWLLHVVEQAIIVTVALICAGVLLLFWSWVVRVVVLNVRDLIGSWRGWGNRR